MELEPVPTSPKVLAQHKKSPLRLGMIVLIAVLASIFGFLAGMVGGSVNISRESIANSLIIKSDQEKTWNEEQTNDLSSPVVSFVEKKENKRYILSDVSGYGVLISNDGWILTTRTVIGDGQENRYEVVTASGKNFSLQKTVTDSFSDFIFIKTDAKTDNLSTLSDEEVLPRGSTLHGINLFADEYGKDMKVFTAHVTNPLADINEASSQSSEKMKTVWTIEKDSDVKNGTPFFTSRGELAGLFYKQEKDILLPARYINSVIKDVLAVQDIKRPLLGIQYIDIQRNSGLKTAGSLLRPEVTGPAREAGLKPDDIILEVNRQKTSNGRTLSTLLLDFPPDEEVPLLISRGGEEKILQVKLGQAK